MLTQWHGIQPLNADEIQAVTGGSDIPPPIGFWDWIPGFLPPWTDPNDNPIPGAIDTP